MTPGATPPKSPDFETRANAFLEVARDTDIWSISDDTESDGSENDAYASDDGSDDSDFSASRVDLRELEALIARLHARGVEFVRPKTTQKHRDIHTLVASAPRAQRPTIIPRGSIPGLPEPFVTTMQSDGVRAQREGLRWMKISKAGGERVGGSGGKKNRKRASRLESETTDEDKTAVKKRKKHPTEAQAHQERKSASSRPMTEEDRTRRGREIMWAQHLVAQREAEASDASESNDDADADASDREPSVAGTASGPSSPSDAQPRSDAADGGRVLLTVCWRARTRARSGAQPTPVVSVPVTIANGETCMRFMSRMVTMPPGGVYIRDAQLTWGDCVLEPLSVLDGAQTGAWRLDVRSAVPQELTLRIPVGATLAHGALREAAGEKGVTGACGFAVRRGKNGDFEFTKTGVGFFGAEPGEGGATSSIDGSRSTGSGAKSASLFATCVKDLSNRALHPGRTDPKGMAEILRAYKVIQDDAACSLVDVGSGDGHFAAGLARAFPNAGVCGIEAQRDLYEESLKFENDANFICGLAENELEKCVGATVVIATTHNFDASSVEATIRITARLPSLTHLVMGESSLCTARCKAVVGPCCCFVHLGAEEVPTHWGNSHLTFSLYKRVARWVLDGNSAERVSDRATLAALDSGEIDASLPIPVRRKGTQNSRRFRRKTGETVRSPKKNRTNGKERGASPSPVSFDQEEHETPPRATHDSRVLESSQPHSPRSEHRSPRGGREPSPNLAKSPGYVNRMLRTMA